MKSISKAVMVLGAGLVVMLGVSRRTAASHSGCKDVKGNVSTVFSSGPCSSLTGMCTTGSYTQAGKLTGATTYDLNALTTSATAGISSYAGKMILTTNHGTLHFTDSGLVDFGGGVFTELQTITGGTGVFSNATGTTFVSGLLTADRTGFNGKLSGRICLANSDDLDVLDD